MAPWTETQKKRLVSQIRIWGNQWDNIADHPELQGRNGKACKQRAFDAASGIPVGGGLSCFPSSSREGYMVSA